MTEADIKKGIRITDDLKVDAELRELFTRIAYSDPNITAQFGNHDANVIIVTTPSVANTEFATKHSLGRIPVGVYGVIPLSATIPTGGQVSIPALEKTQAADSTYVYFRSPNTSYTFGMVIW